MAEYFQITLTSHDLGQQLDGLRTRADAWAKTAAFLESGFSGDDAFICEECSDFSEARRIAQHYENIIADVETQMAKQGG